VDVGWSLATSRAAFEHRAVVVGAGRDELAAGLRAVAEGRPGAGVVEGAAGAGGGVVFVFPGQGAQWAGMAVELLESSPVFAEAMAACAGALAPWVDWSLPRGARRRGGAGPGGGGPAGAVGGDGLAGRAVAFLRGRAPAAVVGHSQGEVAAACVAGGLSLADGARVVVARSRAIADTLAGQGAMAALPVPAARAAELVARWPGQLWVAAVNGPTQAVVSGAPEAVEALLAHCADQGVQARRVPVGYASHSPAVEQLRGRLDEELAGIGPRPSTVPVYSSVTGEAADTASWDAGYWYRNLRRPVVFDRALGAALADGRRAVLEVSPHPVLTPAAQEVLDGRGPLDGHGASTGWRWGPCAAATAACGRCSPAWPSFMCTESGSTGRRCSAPGPSAARTIAPRCPGSPHREWAGTPRAAGHAGWTCRPMPSSVGGTGRRRPPGRRTWPRRACPRPGIRCWARC
jgi:acyl transferase domain-containing protein